MDIQKIKELIALVNETGIAELEIAEGESAVRITRQFQSPQLTTVAALPEVPAKIHAATKIETDDLAGHIVRSPMVGTLYLANAPEAEPFVKVGSRVNKGDVICVIEAMKMFNQIEADASGTIKTKLVENGAPVEYNQPLFIIEEN
jgi:acetyl-CoA carboxylase biotin carboxyl carrier protein